MTNRIAIDATDLESLADCDSDLVEEVAKAIVNADIDEFGGIWPWPSGDADFEIRHRRNARLAARVAIKAFLAWQGHERIDVTATHPFLAAPPQNEKGE